MLIKKIVGIGLALVLLLGPGASRVLAESTVKMRIVIVNPSATKAQEKSIKSLLPREVTAKDVLDSGGLEVDYDEENGLYYVHKAKVELAPSETKVFEVVMDDVWLISEDKLEQYKKKTEMALERLKDSAYFAQAELIAKTILGRLDEIHTTQSDPDATKQQHIAYYRDNLQTLHSVDVDLEKLEKILTVVGAAPSLDFLEKSDVNLKSPSTKTTWVIIFIIFIFVGILSATFYFTWMKQEKFSENIFTREKDPSFTKVKSPPEEKSP